MERLNSVIATEPICWSELRDSTIVSEDPLNDGGRSVAYSKDENFVAMASPVGDGTVRVYALDKHTGAFTQIGADIENDTEGCVGKDGDEGEEKPYSHLQRTEPLISDDGSVVAIASHILSDAVSAGLVVRVFEYDDHSDSWVRRGSDIVRTLYET